MYIDTAKTAIFYQSLTPDDLCSCTDCKNFRRYIQSFYPELSDWLHALGIDIKKAAETSPLEMDKQGYMEYGGCQYIAFGSCQPDYRHQIGSVTIRKAESYPPTGISEPHFVLECFPVHLPADDDLI